MLGGRCAPAETIEAVRGIMDLATAQYFFGYCFVIGSVVLLLWSVIFRFAHDWHFRIAKLWFQALSVETYYAVNLAGLSAFKIAVVALFLIPFVALSLLRC